MDKYIFDESNGLWYELQGDYYILCLILSEEETQPIGLWGQRHKQYLKEHKHFLYTTMLIEGTLNRYLAVFFPTLGNVADCFGRLKKSFKTLPSGEMVVSQSCSGFISPRPL